MYPLGDRTVSVGLEYHTVLWRFAIEDIGIVTYLVLRSKQTMLFGPRALDEAKLLLAIPDQEFDFSQSMPVLT